MRAFGKILTSALLIAGMALSSAWASSDPRLEKPISYYVLHQDIKSVLADISKVTNVPIVVSSNVKGKTTSGRYEGTATEVLNEIAEDLNLHWYFDGNAIYVTHVSSAITHVVVLKGYSYQQLVHSLSSIGLNTQRFPMMHDRNNNIVMIYGPPRYVAAIELVANNLALYRLTNKPKVTRN